MSTTPKETNAALLAHSSSADAKPRLPNGVAIALMVVWAVLVGSGVVMLTHYKMTPGAAADPPSEWPVASALPHGSDKATLVLLAHPHCSCTRATLTELAELMSHVSERLLAHVLFVKPEGVAPGWEQTSLVEQARAIPGVTVSVDDGGSEAARFRVTTSGQTIVYDALGHLMFAGGITGARGHAGDNAGVDRIKALLEGKGDLRQSPVFGCNLGEAPVYPLAQ